MTNLSDNYEHSSTEHINDNIIYCTLTEHHKLRVPDKFEHFGCVLCMSKHTGS
jgi:hypothetical protein